MRVVCELPESGPVAQIEEDEDDSEQDQGGLVQLLQRQYN